MIGRDYADRIQKTVSFINNDATSVHGYIRSSTVFTSESGEWKLGGFDVLSSLKEDDAIIYASGMNRSFGLYLQVIELWKSNT